MKPKSMRPNVKRFEWLNQMIMFWGFTTGVEVGSGTGKTAMEILQKNPKLHLIEVAYYPSDVQLPKDHLEYCTTPKAKKLWQQRIRRFHSQVKILRLPSREAVLFVPDDSQDFVFIDADHSYEECLFDIQAWSKKVRPGGLICGHDWDHPDFPGVAKAVIEVFGNSFQTTDDRVWFSWKTND